MDINFRRTLFNPVYLATKWINLPWRDSGPHWPLGMDASSVMFDSVQPHGWTVACQTPLSMDSPGKNTGVDCHSILQGIFPTQGSNPGLLHCRQILCHLSHQGVFKCGEGMGQAKRGWQHVLVFCNGQSIPGPKTVCLVLCNPFLTKDKSKVC